MPSDIAVIGLGAMGSNLVLNIANYGHQVAMSTRPLVRNRELSILNSFDDTSVDAGHPLHPNDECQHRMVVQPRTDQALVLQVIRDALYVASRALAFGQTHEAGRRDGTFRTHRDPDGREGSLHG